MQSEEGQGKFMKLNGCSVIAVQHCNPDHWVHVANLHLSTNDVGLVVKAEIGDVRRYVVETTISPEVFSGLIEEIIRKRVTAAVRQAERRMRSNAAQEAAKQGITLPFLDGDPNYGG